ncbi:MAG: efflux protein ApaG [Bacteroidota bacterium]|jgi:ApaG protein
MVVAVTSGVKVMVQAKFEKALSSISNNNFIFSYMVTIENQNEFPVQLLRRHWFVADAAGVNREIEGPGVIGEQPIIEPGSSFSYTSACDLMSPFGTMIGYYSMQIRGEQSTFAAHVPEFKLFADHALN